MLFRKFSGARGQSSLEFMILVGFLLASFVVFFMLIQSNLSDKVGERIDAEINEVARSIQTEIDLAHSSSDGYSRSFRIPSVIYSGTYKVNLTSEILFVSTEDASHIISLSVKNNTGQINIGENKIVKENGTVKVNP